MNDTANQNQVDEDIDAKVAAMVGLSVEELRKGKHVLDRGSETLKADYIDGKITTEEAFQQVCQEQKAEWAKFIRDSLTNRADAHGFYNNKKQWTEKQPVTEDLIKAHVDHKVTIGLHTTSTDNTCRWCCWDFDRHGEEDVGAANLSGAKSLVTDLEEKGFKPVLEDSNGAGGYHVWVIFDDPVNSWDAYAWMRTIPVEGDPERFPKQAKIDKFGNYVRLPGKHPKRDHHSSIWQGDDEWTLPEDHVWELSDSRIVPIGEPPPLPMEQPAAMSNGHTTSGSQAALDRVASRQLVDVAKLLDLLNQGRCDSYDEWLKVGMIVHGCDPSDAGLALWDEWSRNSAKYEPGVCSQKWQSFTGGGGRPVTIGSLRRWAREDSPTEYESFFPKADPKGGFDPCAASRDLVADEYMATVPTLRRHGGAWWSFDGSVYQQLPKDELETVAWTWLDARFTTARKRMVDETVCSMRAVPGVAVPANQTGWLDGSTGPEPRDAIEVRNGTIDADTGEFIPVTPSRFRRSAAPFDFNENAGEPVNWLTFLDQTFGGDRGAIGVLQEFIGLSLVLDLSHQRILYLHGEPRSGKGTILQVMEGLVGDEGRVSATPKMFDDQFALASMVGKRLCVVPDARFEKGSLTANVVERLLSISAGDSLPVRGMRQIATTARLDARLVICSNTPPSVMSDGALQTRLLPLLTRRSFDKPDPNLFERKLKPELPSILVWALEGLHRLRRRGRFPEPKPIEQATFEHDLETLLGWMRDRADDAPFTPTDLKQFAHGRVRSLVDDLLPHLVRSGAIRREGSNFVVVGAAS